MSGADLNPSDEHADVTRRARSDYQRVARVIRRSLDEDIFLRRASSDWPESSDPSLEEAFDLLRLWHYGGPDPDPEFRPELRTELEKTASQLEAGQPLVDSLTNRLWNWSVIIQDHRNGLLFLIAAGVVVGIALWAVFSPLWR
ncbi:MAG: hypothetical protein Q8K99_14435 [Actinomycetota bacterium]|nr:hypothetical protein [Actinomycetota bacterium]